MLFYLLAAEGFFWEGPGVCGYGMNKVYIVLNIRGLGPMDMQDMGNFKFYIVIMNMDNFICQLSSDLGQTHRYH